MSEIEELGKTQRELHAAIYEFRFLQKSARRTVPSLNAVMHLLNVVRTTPELNRSYTSKPKAFTEANGDICVQFKYKNALLQWTMSQNGALFTVRKKPSRVEGTSQAFAYPFEEAKPSYGLEFFASMDPYPARAPHTL
ncbi:MAG TPA: hypothetical protein VN081_03070 [Dongiaceae bacterium]|nr:hypothetical protein [Dongiaceae bacterium]